VICAATALLTAGHPRWRCSIPLLAEVGVGCSRSTLGEVLGVFAGALASFDRICPPCPRAHWKSGSLPGARPSPIPATPSEARRGVEFMREADRPGASANMAALR
jgi:hypothetical protein